MEQHGSLDEHLAVVARWIQRAAKGAGHLHTEWRPPATAETVAACEEALGLKLPPSLHRLLTNHHDGGILLYDTTFHRPREDSGLHIFGASPDFWNRTIVTQTEYLWACHGEHMRGLVGFGHTPGAGAFYLAMDGKGRVIDLFGLPDRKPGNPTTFEPYRGEWRIIASSLEDLVTRMLQELETQPDRSSGSGDDHDARRRTGRVHRGGRRPVTGVSTAT